MKIQVITKVPKEGNLYDDILIKGYDKDNNCEYWEPFEGKQTLTKENYINVKLPVFTKGEIIIVDENDREIGGIMRKPSKWFIEYKEFKLKDLEKAIKLAKRISK